MIRKGNPLAKELAQLAAFSIAWAAIALIAYFLPLQPDTLQANATAVSGGHAVCQNATPLALPGIQLCNQHIAFPTQYAGTTLVLWPIPIAALALLILSIVARIRRPGSALIGIYLFVAAVGAVCTTLIFISTLGQNDAIRSFIVAAEVIVISTVVGRLQKPIRRAFTDHPAISSLGTLVIVYASFVLAQAVTFTQILLEEVNVWVLAIAFGLLVYSGAGMLNRARKLEKAH